ncbi:F-actin-uncapping protein LRRC16A isoform X6 [Diprion similis]|uniref:F-actin-uncapping protein LRRC16A isoform X6 n=1 Tax=Diprion similis TaxID=362088 RepID=UPI001EF82DBE|nr:F-actin-uncapping protein LRRC16A isoform X6 [Diprion similis]
MSTRSQLTKDLNESVKSLLGKHVKILLKNVVRLETKQDKQDNRVLVFSPCRLFLLTAKVPTRIDCHFHYLEITAVESKRGNQLSLTVGDRIYSFTTMGGGIDTAEVDAMIEALHTAIRNIFPTVPLNYIIRKIDVIPTSRLQSIRSSELARSTEATRHTGPCGGFSTQYACMCDLHGVPYRDEVAWDVDTIYLSHDTRELNLRDFDHLEQKDLVPIISALEYNTWFTKLRASHIKLSHEHLERLLHVMRRSLSIQEIYLDNLGFKWDFAHKLSIALISNTNTMLHTIDLSNNMIEDKGASSLCGIIAKLMQGATHLSGLMGKLPKGLQKLNLAHCGLTGKGINQIAHALSLNRSMPSSLQYLNLSGNSLKDDVNNLCNFLAQPNSLTHLDLSGTDTTLECLFGALLRGCATNLVHLNVARNSFSSKKTKEIPPSFKQFFTATLSLKYMNISFCKLPLEGLKNLLLGLACNESTVELELDMSGNNLGSMGAHVLESCIHGVRCISSLDISDSNMDVDLAQVITAVSKNKSIKQLYMGRNLAGMKTKHIAVVMEALVTMMQEDDCVLQALHLPDSRLKSDLFNLINALGSNTCLHTLDISGNQIGDAGCRTRSSTPDVLRSSGSVSAGVSSMGGVLIKPAGRASLDSEEEGAASLSFTDTISQQSSDQSPMKLEYLNLATPHLSNKRKSLHGRKLRPKSVVDSIEGLSADDIPDLLPSLPKNQAEVISENEHSLTESLDSVSELPNTVGPQLQHLVKSRPRRTKTRAPTRPMLRPDQLADGLAIGEGLDTFFRPTTPTTPLVSPTSDDSSLHTFPTDGSPNLSLTSHKGVAFDVKVDGDKKQGRSSPMLKTLLEPTPRSRSIDNLEKFSPLIGRRSQGDSPLTASPLARRNTTESAQSSETGGTKKDISNESIKDGLVDVSKRSTLPIVNSGCPKDETNSLIHSGTTGSFKEGFMDNVKRSINNVLHVSKDPMSENGKRNLPLSNVGSSAQKDAMKNVTNSSAISNVIEVDGKKNINKRIAVDVKPISPGISSVKLRSTGFDLRSPTNGSGPKSLDAEVSKSPILKPINRGEGSSTGDLAKCGYQVKMKPAPPTAPKPRPWSMATDRKSGEFNLLSDGSSPNTSAGNTPDSGDALDESIDSSLSGPASLPPTLSASSTTSSLSNTSTEKRSVRELAASLNKVQTDKKEGEHLVPAAWRSVLRRSVDQQDVQDGEVKKTVEENSTITKQRRISLLRDSNFNYDNDIVDV